MQHGHDVRVPGDPPHRPLLASELFEVDIVLVRTEHLHCDDAVEGRFIAAIHDAESATAHRLGIVVALSLEFGCNPQRGAALSGIGAGRHGLVPGYDVARCGSADPVRPTQRVAAQPTVNIPITDAFVAAANRTPAGQADDTAEFTRRLPGRAAYGLSEDGVSLRGVNGKDGW